MQLKNLVTVEDIGKLPVEMVHKICKDYAIPTDSDFIVLSEQIYQKLNSSSPESDELFTFIQPIIFAGRKAVTWYNLPEIASEVDIHEFIVDHTGVNPFEQIIPRNPGSLNGEAKIVSAARVGSTGEKYLIRFMAKSHENRFWSGSSYERQTVGAIVSVLIDQDNRFIEIRDNPKYNARVIKEINYIFGLRASEKLIRPIEPFGNRVEDIARALPEGKVYSAYAMPELILEDLNENQVAGVTNVLLALNEYFESDNDTIIIEQALNDCKECLDDFAAVPFLAILLSGMTKLGLTVNEIKGDIANQPLMAALSPFLQNHGGHIRFKINAEQDEFHTIRVGLQTNAISFKTHATEEAITVVREAVLGLN